MSRVWVGALLVCATLLTAAATSAQATLLAFTPAERRQILSHGPWPPPVALDAGNAHAGKPDAIALGQALFFEARLSPDASLSCATCHLPALAFADGRARSVGRAPLQRNAPSLWNAVHERWYGWDGAADSLWSQALRPLLDPREMASNPEHVARTITTDPALACRYRQAFGSEPSADPQRTLVHAAKALGAFTGSLVSGRTAFDAFRDALQRGDRRAAARYPLAAQRGLRLFVGRGQCTVCHTGPMFSNGEFGDTGLPFFSQPGVVDPGRHGGIAALRASPYTLLSKWSDASDAAVSLKTRHVVAQHRNFGEFKVPSLRNVADTAPYMHDGQLATLADVVQHYSEMNQERLHADGEQILKPLHLSPRDRADLVAFLHSLSDPAARRWQPAPSTACLSPTP
jgi:cytochrome c peroxidase